MPTGRSLGDVSEYYVTLNGDRVAGPFDSRTEAKQWADEEGTNEVGLNYLVERAT